MSAARGTMRVRRRGVLVMLLGSALTGCSRSGTGDSPAAPLKAMSAAALRAVPVEASLDMPVQASLYAWRDLMPGPADTARAGRDLMLSVQVRGGVVPPKGLACDAIYLVHGDSVHAARPDEQRAGDGPGAVECILRGGPAWPVGAPLQVIISVSAGNQRALIRRETVIDATS
ncbi:MAG TPA: hypothetical protein VE861_01870 [Gemmatimonadaceae bacterium]|nr:hypothetical protein [Gemmatimonadaceae bacterium]